MKKILILSPHNPFLRSNGGENRIYLIIKELSKENKIILVCPNGKKEKLKNVKIYQEFEDKPNKKTLNFSLIKRLKEIIKIENPNKIQIEYLWQGINIILLGENYIIDAFDIVFLRFKRAGSLLWLPLFLYEILVYTLAQKIICVSETDKNYLMTYFKLNSSKIKIIENPIDKTKFFPNPKVKNEIRTELQLKNKEKLILFFGQLDYKPNIEALEVIKDKIIPGLNRTNKRYKIVICGKGDGKGLLNQFKSNNLVFKGFVNRIQDYINAADVVIAPLKSGSGTRIKILEALACKKRVVSTSIGAEGIKTNKLLEIENDWEKFVKRI
jgi:glycosyltransferase involved in cell wall biosynthesis